MAAFHLYCLLFYSFLLKTQQTDMPDDQVAACVALWVEDEASMTFYDYERAMTAAQQTLNDFKRYLLNKSDGGSWKWGASSTGITIQLDAQEAPPYYRYVLRHTNEYGTSPHVLTEQPSIHTKFYKNLDLIIIKLVHNWGLTSVNFVPTDPPGSWYQWRSLTKCYVEEAVKSFKVTGQHGKLKIFKKWFAKQSVEGQWTNGGYQFILEMALMPKQKKHSYSYYAKHLPDGGAIKCLVPTIKVADDTFTVVFTYLQQQGEITSVGLAYDKAIP
eukprot:GHVS01012604.1.p1 GENE.GHVS01012604.1~~GHVS01012604.1.p1  ORF type:complete len:272 (-),score=22.61 GHVS01012604.1:502-1317(-)